MDFDLKDFLKKMPTGPGVYLMLGSEHQILYVGKAKNLKNRVRSYFNKNQNIKDVIIGIRKVEIFYA